MLRLAVIGLGGRICGIIKLVLLHDREARLVAVADPNKHLADDRVKDIQPSHTDVKWYDSAEKLLEHADQYDAILIGTRCHLHTPIAVMAAATKLPLFLEKPVAITTAQLKALHQAYRGREDEVVVSFPLRCTPLFTSSLEIVRSGRLGTINQVQAINNVSYGGVYFGEWYRNYDEVGGLWLQKATHDFDYLNLLMNCAPMRIAGTMSQKVYGGTMPHELRCNDCDLTETCMESPKNLMRRGEDGGVASHHPDDKNHFCAFSREIYNEDAGSAIVQYSNGAHVNYTQNFITRRSAGRRGAILTGYSGTLEFDWMTEVIRVTDHHQNRVDEISVKASTGHSGGDDVLVQNFIDLIRGKAKSRSTLSDGLLSVAMCLAARRSCHLNTFQPIPKVEDISRLPDEPETIPTFVR
jgi:predicted dehydrogenase